MNKRAKGSAYELAVQKHLESEGYIVHRARASNFRVQGKVLCRSNDIFQVFDIIAKKQDRPTLWIQVTTGPRRAEKQKKLDSIPSIWNEKDVLQLWLRYPQGEWKIYQLRSGEFQEIAKIERGKYYEIREAENVNN